MQPRDTLHPEPTKGPGRPPQRAAAATASLGDRSCWSDNAPSRAPASATRTIRRHPLLQISARASRPSPSTTRGGRASRQRPREVRRRPGWRRAAPATQRVTRACLNLGHVSRRPRSRPQRRREHRRDVGQLATSRASDERAITWGQCGPAQPIHRGVYGQVHRAHNSRERAAGEQSKSEQRSLPRAGERSERRISLPPKCGHARGWANIVGSESAVPIRAHRGGYLS